MDSNHIFVLCIIGLGMGIPIICGTILALVKQFHQRQGKMSSQLNSEESKIMHDLYKGLERMEKRIDALETIIIDKKR
ncbi:phage shock protein B [Puniceicoccaceae bacterium K14]|nr:phage shock protein B [Puniceicoccaceae bacterium K14]